jgi:hypothetical protein
VCWRGIRRPFLLNLSLRSKHLNVAQSNRG